MQLEPPVPPTLIGPVRLLLVQPGLHADVPYPPQVLQHGQVGAPDGIVGELDEACAGEILALGAAFQPPLGDAAADVAGAAMRSRRALATVAAAPVADPVQNKVAANAAVETARGSEVVSIVWHLVLLIAASLSMAVPPGAEAAGLSIQRPTACQIQPQRGFVD
jgi:hypothetical protein